MPNHCYNTITITGEGTAAIKKKLGSRKVLREGILKHLVPRPKILEDSVHGGALFSYQSWVSSGRPDTADIRGEETSLDEEYMDGKTYREVFVEYDKLTLETGHASWYTWSLENWGSKWGFYDVEVNSFRKDIIEFRANSAWCPPCKGLETLATNYGVQVEIETTEEASQFSFKGTYFPNGAKYEVEMPGCISKECETLSVTQYSEFAHLIDVVDEEGSYCLLEHKFDNYKEYVKWSDSEN